MVQCLKGISHTAANPISVPLQTMSCGWIPEHPLEATSATHMQNIHTAHPCRHQLSCCCSLLFPVPVWGAFSRMDSTVGSRTNVLGLKMGASFRGPGPRRGCACVLSETVFKLVVSSVHRGQEEVSLHCPSGTARD